MDSDGYQGRHCLLRTDHVIAAVDAISTVLISRRISDEGHRKLPVGSNNFVMISKTYVTGNSNRYFMGPSDTIWPRTVFSVRYRSFVIFVSVTEDYDLKQSN